jgi:DNA-binding NarL/FixJ family response regulator
VSSQRVRVLVTGDEPLLDRGLALLLDREHDLEPIYVESCARAGKMLGSGRSEIVVWCGGRLGKASLDALREVRAAHPATGLCLLARGADLAALERLLACGADRFAFVINVGGLEVGEVVEILRGVLRGRSTVPPTLLERLTCDAVPNGALELTESEREIMELVAIGLRNCEIARRLWKSEKAVEKHIGRVFTKLGLRPDTHPHLDRRVTATRIFLARRAAHAIAAHNGAFEPPGVAAEGSGVRAARG